MKSKPTTSLSDKKTKIFNPDGKYCHNCMVAYDLVYCSPKDCVCDCHKKPIPVEKTKVEEGLKRIRREQLARVTAAFVASPTLEKLMKLSPKPLPKHMPTSVEKTKDWEKEFDSYWEDGRFMSMDGEEVASGRVKAYIKELLSHQKAELVEKIRKWGEREDTMSISTSEPGYSGKLYVSFYDLLEFLDKDI